MVITIHPRGRSKYNDLATLKIQHAKGIFETPNRVVNRHDLNAKDEIGADIPLTRTSKSFIVEEIIDQEKLNRIVNENGYLDTMVTKTNALAHRVDTSNSLVFLYPSLTNEAYEILNSSFRQYRDFLKFFCDVASYMNLETLLIPLIGNLEDTLKMVQSRQLQLIPVLGLKTETKILTNQFLKCRTTGSNDIPLIAFRFAPYTKANKGYDLVMDNLDRLHEDGQATMLVNVPRNLDSGSLNVSAPHYGSFIMADIVAEKYHGKGFNPTKRRSVRLFCRKDLVTPVIQPSHLTNRKLDLESEKQVFSNDKKLQELLERIVENKTDEKDWSNNRPVYLSRVHENVRTRDEFSVFQKNIDNNTTNDYLNEKKDMNNVVKNHLKNRFKGFPIK